MHIVPALDWSPLALIVAALALMAALLTFRLTATRSRQASQQAAGHRSRPSLPATAAAHAAQAALPAKSYVPFSPALSSEDVLIVDCTHPGALTLTHHKGHRNPPLALLPGNDTSTGLALDALRAQRSRPELAAWLGKRHISVNHFDNDALLSAWTVINGEQALQHEAVLRHASRIGDFREAALGASPEAQQVREWDGVTSQEQVYEALKLACWINTVELSRFSAPFEDKDADEKFAFFLGVLLVALEDLEALRSEWEEEYNEVLEGWRLLEDGAEGGSVARHAQLGLAVIRSPRPLHYYCLFSHAIGCDVVLSQYPGNRYELESRYTQFINLFSRPCTARLELVQLAKLLNEIDTGREAGTSWTAPRLVDTGPLLRLDRDGLMLSKAERYGHPTQRPMFSSGLAPEAFEELVASYFEHGLHGVKPKVGGWSWEELHELNEGIDWKPWRAEVLRRFG